ncbi:MAG: flagellar biosynthesis regulator FlaF [Sneathiella sp.]|nr:flagellar biosynthesis regulator FlaF [Sneathiella sp.]
MYFEAYKKANLATENPTQTEYRLFAEITRELETANTRDTTFSNRINALFRNNQLWLTIQTDLVSDQNKLDKETKAGLFSLAIWVEKFSFPAMRTSADLEPLISINKQIMQGLSGAAKTARMPAQSVRQEQFAQVSI